MNVNRTVSDYGTIRYKNKDGKLHRDGDKPAVVYADARAVDCQCAPASAS